MTRTCRHSRSAGPHPENVASQRVAVNAGFRRDGIELAYAEFKDGTEDAIRYVRSVGA
jgi:RimJ/RimL family protein N-acetyltransferase